MKNSFPSHEVMNRREVWSQQVANHYSKRRFSRVGALIVNADDWGRTFRTPANTRMRCSGTVSSVSAMVFMEDSERAATIARDAIDTGLHLLQRHGASDPARSEHRRVRDILGATAWLNCFHPGLINHSNPLSVPS
jgi:hypothetical protein